MTEPKPKAKQIADALLLLDPAEDSHWNREGLPSMIALKELVDIPITREDVNAVDPDFVRPNVVSGTVGPGDSGAQDPHADATAPSDGSEAESPLGYADALAALKQAQEAFEAAKDNLHTVQAAFEEAKDRDPTQGRRWSFEETQAYMKERAAERHKVLADATLEFQKNAPPNTVSPLDQTLRGQRRPIPPHPSLGLKPAAQ